MATESGGEAVICSGEGSAKWRAVAEIRDRGIQIHLNSKHRVATDRAHGYGEGTGGYDSRGGENILWGQKSLPCGPIPDCYRVAS